MPGGRAASGTLMAVGMAMTCLAPSSSSLVALQAPLAFLCTPSASFQSRCLLSTSCFLTSTTSHMKLFPASSLPPAPSSSPLVPPKVSYGRRRLHVCHAGAGKEEWWEARGQVPFACTECGKCCQVYGDVWCAPAEVSGLMEYFSMTREEVSSNFGKMEVDGWLLLKDKSFGDSQGCIFLSEDKKTCGIYENRPVQCRVYPFFPRIMKTPESWNAEVVKAGPNPSSGDGEGKTERYWTAETGGCEGMQDVKDVRWNQKKKIWKTSVPKGEEGVPAEEIGKQLNMYENVFINFPHEQLLAQTSSEGKELKASSDAISSSMANKKSNPKPAMTKEGIGQEISKSPAPIPYDQIFAISNMVSRELRSSKEKIDTSNQPEVPLQDEDANVRYIREWAVQHVVRLGLCPWASGVIDKLRILVREDITDEDQAKELFIQEAQKIIETPEEELPTTIIAFPNLYPDFLDWNDFAEFMEDELENGELYDIGEHVLIAAFHPQYEFGGIEPEEAYLHYEKRAPFPMMNLLRTEAIDRGVKIGYTAERIRAHNEAALREEGVRSLEGFFRHFGRRSADTENHRD